MASYLVHFNPNHDPKNGQFTFSRKDQKANMRAIRKHDAYEGFLSTEYDKKFQKEVESHIKRDETEDDSYFRIQADYPPNDKAITNLHNIGLDDEIKNFLGKYANLPYNRIETLADHITKEEAQRLRDQLSRMVDNERQQFKNQVYEEGKKVLKGVDYLEASSEIWNTKEKDSNKFFKENPRISKATDIAMKILGDEWIEKRVKNYDSWDGEKYAEKPTKLQFLQASTNYPDYSKAAGHVQIADLALQGYTKKQILDISKAASKIAYECADMIPDSDRYSLEAFWNSPTDFGEKFIDACIKEAKKENLK